VPGGGLPAISGVESGKLAPLITEPAVDEVHPLGAALPSGVMGATVPVALPVVDVEVVAEPNGSGISVVLATAVAAIDPVAATVDGVVAGIEGPVTGAGTGIGGAVTSPRIVAKLGGAIVVAPPAAGVDVAAAGAVVTAGAAIVPIAVTVTGAVAGVTVVACAGNGEQLTLVPGVVGSSASGTGARVVSGTPETVAAENGLGPLRGDDTIAPGVDGIPIAVVPMVETCARQVLAPNHNAVIAVVRNGRIRAHSCLRSSLSAWPAVFAARPCRRRPD
jgi:hypothetical protein